MSQPAHELAHTLITLIIGKVKGARARPEGVAPGLKTHGGFESTRVRMQGRDARACAYKYCIFERDAIWRVVVELFTTRAGRPVASPFASWVSIFLGSFTGLGGVSTMMIAVDFFASIQRRQRLVAGFRSSKAFCGRPRGFFSAPGGRCGMAAFCVKVGRSVGKGCMHHCMRCRRVRDFR